MLQASIYVKVDVTELFGIVGSIAEFGGPCNGAGGGEGENSLRRDNLQR